jgi:general secretion pathway protein H
MGCLRKARKPAPDEAGYLLLELLVVLAILALALGLALPNHRSSGAALEPRTFAMRLVSELRLARTTAILRARDVVFEFNSTERWTQIEGLQRVALPAALNLTVVATRARAANSVDARLVFFRDGSSTGGEITVRGGDVAHVIWVDWMTGVVRVEASTSK